MARVMKSFNTEAEFEEWVNSPDMRTPYTCSIKENGNVHFFDGDDYDYSITITIRKTGWIRLGSTMLTKYIKCVYRNGEQLDINSMPSNCDSSFYYRKEKKPYGSFDYYEKNDFMYHAVLSEPNAESRGGVWHNGNLVQFYPRRFGQMWKYDSNKYWDRTNDIDILPRFMYVKKDDVVKIVFYSEKAIINEYPNKKIFGERKFKDAESNSPKLFSFNKWAKEMVIGDGFHEINGELLRSSSIKKVYFGKNVQKIYNPVNLFGNYYKKTAFVRSKAQIIDDGTLGRVNGKIVII